MNLLHNDIDNIKRLLEMVHEAIKKGDLDEATLSILLKDIEDITDFCEQTRRELLYEVNETQKQKDNC